ncbi:MAG: hypothetical protein Q9207_003901 [Kuettlingeria erythrocarpa]
MTSSRDWSVPAPCYQQPLDPTFPVNCTIELRHPGLADSRSNLLFRFPAYDRLNGGVHYGVALTACAIVAGNKWTGYLSDAAGGPPAADGLREGVDQVLTGKRYYFHPHPYSAEETDVAHIIPVNEGTWFAENDMADYAHDTWTVDNSANLVLLRKDIHYAYDHFKWTIAPKSSKWCCIYADSAQELGALYHNVEVRPLHGVSTEYLLAGFANAIFYLLYPFLNNNASKRLVGDSVGTQDPTGKEVSGIWCTEKFRIPGSRTRSTSPPKARSPKRKHAEDNMGTYDDAFSRSRLYNSAASLLSSRKRLRASSAILASDSDRPRPSQLIKIAPDSPADAPCSCVISGLPTPEPTTSRDGEPPELALAKFRCRSKSCRTVAEFHRHNSLREAALEKERARSKVADWWQGQLRWAKDCSRGKQNGYDVEEWFWVKGDEVLDKDGEYLDTSEVFGRKIGWVQPQVDQAD